MKMVSDMFSRFNNEPVEGRKVNFYGNSGVCLFKFFVRDDEPQKIFSWFVILQNAMCFLVVSFSYMIVYVTVADSSKTVAADSTSNKRSNSQASVSRRKRSDKNRVLNRKITMVILTDFLCWVPFIFICSLHYFEVLDATKLYSLFSIVILPLNSVINPLLYDNSGLMDFAREKLLKLSCKVSFSKMPQNIKRIACETELGKINNGRGGQMRDVRDTTVDVKNTTLDDADKDVITMHLVTNL